MTSHRDPAAPAGPSSERLAGAPPAISVCIPVFNGVRHVGAAVESVLRQTRGDFELVVIDNCSDDGTYELLTRFRDPRLRLLRNDRNIGAEGNWNRALREASGRYVKLLCADDVLYPRCLERQAAVLDRDEAGRISLVTSPRHLLDDSGRRLPLPARRLLPAGTVPAADVLRRVVRTGTNPVGEPCAVLFRREVALRTGAFDASIPYMIDIDYWSRLLAHGDLHMVDEPLCAFRLTRGSWSAQLAAKQTEQTARFIALLVERADVRASALDRALGALRRGVRSHARQLLYRLA